MVETCAAETASKPLPSCIHDNSSIGQSKSAQGQILSAAEVILSPDPVYMQGQHLIGEVEV